MGGPANNVLWVIGYGPLVAAVGGPAFGGELANLTGAARRPLRTRRFLLAAGLAAGLAAATHHCAELATD
eukprot:11219937-Lingulodinium_polyedra.AAC.1